VDIRARYALFSLLGFITKQLGRQETREYSLSAFLSFSLYEWYCGQNLHLG